ncbi:translocation protein TolB [Bacillus sp. SCS-153A]|uniref:translocation protein TolB n=1 Tax=Rossellomorea sedimentorum TaxID=3115294 RepID=UPI003906177A
MIIRTLFILFSFLFLQSPVHAETNIKAAFIRGHQLWIKDGIQEIQVTKDAYVHSPKWSYDGRFVAYIDGDEEGKKRDLYIYDTTEKEIFQPYLNMRTTNFKWSPIRNQLAYTSGGVLNVTKTKNGRPHGFENVSLGADDFEWFPNGKEFIVSSQPNLLPTGWGPIKLFRIPLDAQLSPENMKVFYTIEIKDPEFFAITADHFKWSHNGKWLSFLATPTASWSTDSNTLCVLTSEGEKFHTVGKMLWYPQWMKWSPSADHLAYISGEGRFFVENKKSTIADMPAAIQQKEYTPQGYVDLNIEWFTHNRVIVARSKENKEWEEGPIPTMFTALYLINIDTDHQEQITFPKRDNLDRDPQVVGSTITWMRKGSELSTGDVWMKESLNGPESILIKEVDSAPVFYKN